MTKPDQVLKVGVEAGLAANTVYYLHEGRLRPVREGGYEGGLIPDPQPYNAVEQMQFAAGGLTARWVLLHVLIIPFVLFWLAFMGGIAAALSNHGHTLPTTGIVWLGVSGLFGLLILRRIFRFIDGRPTKRVAARSLRATSSVAVLPPRRPAPPSGRQTRRR